MTRGDARPASEHRANAEYIVQAVNSHADLLAACKAMMTILGEAMIDGLFEDEQEGIGNVLEAARAAIAKAGGE